jgi:hypothetical protein
MPVSPNVTSCDVSQSTVTSTSESITTTRPSRVSRVSLAPPPKRMTTTTTNARDNSDDDDEDSEEVGIRETRTEARDVSGMFYPLLLKTILMFLQIT